MSDTGPETRRDFALVEDTTPVLVGVAQYMQKCDPSEAKGPAELLSDVGRRAVEDAGGVTDVLAAVDTLAVVNSTTDEPDFDNVPVGRLNNPPKVVAAALGINPARRYSTRTGGNTPQMLINHFAHEISQGRAEVVLTVGGEVLATQLKQALNGVDMSHWGDDGEKTPDAFMLGDSWPGVSKTERDHGLNYPTNTYPIFESAMRAAAGRSIKDHSRWLGEFMHPFTKVAAANANAWFPKERSPEELATETPTNRMVGFPYTKYLNSVIRVDQGGAWLMMSAGKARALGLPQEKWIFLHGCGDAHDTLKVTERASLHGSPAIHAIGKDAFDMAQWSVDDVDFIDLYSCFPSAVTAGCQALGIATNDPRGLTVTGGLPYFGGAGNAYVLCSIARMVCLLRDYPEKKGLVTGNGWFLTKHSIGLYGAEPFTGPWQRKDPANTQAVLDAMDHPVLDETPQGKGTVEGYTVVHSRDAVRMGIVIGKLASGKRFVAHVPENPDLLQRMKEDDLIGVSGQVTPGNPINLFEPHWP